MYTTLFPNRVKQCCAVLAFEKCELKRLNSTIIHIDCVIVREENFFLRKKKESWKLLCQSFQRVSMSRFNRRTLSKHKRAQNLLNFPFYRTTTRTTTKKRISIIVSADLSIKLLFYEPRLSSKGFLRFFLFEELKNERKEQKAHKIGTDLCVVKLIVIMFIYRSMVTGFHHWLPMKMLSFMFDKTIVIITPKKVNSIPIFSTKKMKTSLGDLHCIGTRSTTHISSNTNPPARMHNSKRNSNSTIRWRKKK